MFRVGDPCEVGFYSHRGPIVWRPARIESVMHNYIKVKLPNGESRAVPNNLWRLKGEVQ